MMAVLAGTAMVLAVVGLIQGFVAAHLVASFTRRYAASSSLRPPVTVLKPLHGDELLLEAALTSLFQQNYPHFQIVFGVQHAADPAISVVRGLQARYPDLDVVLVVDPSLHGRNRKVGNLINMIGHARHDVLVVADADIHVRPNYLERLVAALQQPGIGLVTTLYAGLPFFNERLSLPARLGAIQITYGFLPGALLARAFGRQDCLGATMCLRRHDLEKIGGFAALVDHLADDNVLGRRIAALGLRVTLADTVPLTSVTEASFGALFQHELRWARTIRALEPVGFAASILQYPLAWAMLTILLTGGSLWSIAAFLVTWVLRATIALRIDSALAPSWTNGTAASERDDHQVGALAFSCPVWLLPLRDILSVAVMLASYGGRQVFWRGHRLHADTPPPTPRQPMPFRP